MGASHPTPTAAGLAGTAESPTAALSEGIQFLPITDPAPERPSIQYIARSGDPCPTTGWWQKIQSEDTSASTSDLRFLGQGAVMPTDIDCASAAWAPSHRFRPQTEY